MGAMTPARPLLLAAIAICATTLVGAAAGCTPAAKSGPAGATSASPVAASSDEPDPAEPTGSPAPLPAPLTSHRVEVNAGADDTFAVFGTRVDPAGTHTRLVRTYHGLRVYGGDIVLHTDPGGGYKGASSGLT